MVDSPSGRGPSAGGSFGADAPPLRSAEERRATQSVCQTAGSAESARVQHCGHVHAKTRTAR
jgi:hypothetical protein